MEQFVENADWRTIILCLHKHYKSYHALAKAVGASRSSLLRYRDHEVVFGIPFGVGLRLQRYYQQQIGLNIPSKS